MSFVTDFCYRLCRSLSVRLHAQCSYTACRVTNSPISISGISSGCIADTALAPRYDKCHTGIGLLPATVYTTAAVWTRASVWAVHSCRHAVHHAHAPNQGDHDYFEGRLPRRHPNPPFHATNSKAGPASLSSNRRRPLDTSTSPRDQTSGFLMRCKTMRTMPMHSRPLPNPRIMLFQSITS